MKVLIDENALQRRVSELAARIDADYAGRELHVVRLLNGASVFCTDLVRQLHVPVTVLDLGFDSYAGAPRSGEVRITLDVAQPLQDKHVLLVEGMIISGRTPRYLMDALRLRCPASLEICALGVKPAARAVDLSVAYQGFEFGEEVAVGYGMGKGAQRALRCIVAGDAH